MNGITIDWSLIDWRWIFTTLLAAYGAGLATYREVMVRRQRRAVIKVHLSLDIVLIGSDGQIPQVQVRVENHGHADVIFNTNGVSIGVEGWTTMLLMMDPRSDATFPLTLRPGGSYYLIKERMPLLDALANAGKGNVLRVRALVQDAINRPFYSEWQTVDLDERRREPT